MGLSLVLPYVIIRLPRLLHMGASVNYHHRYGAFLGRSVEKFIYWGSNEVPILRA